MQVFDKGLLRMFQLKPRCEFCQEAQRGGLDPHHLWAKGMGGGGQLDIRKNLIALCKSCHCKTHTGEIPRPVLLAIVARREGCTEAEVLESIRTLRNAR